MASDVNTWREIRGNISNFREIYKKATNMFCSCYVIVNTVTEKIRNRIVGKGLINLILTCSEMMYRVIFQSNLKKINLISESSSCFTGRNAIIFCMKRATKLVTPSEAGVF